MTYTCNKLLNLKVIHYLLTNLCKTELHHALHVPCTIFMDVKGQSMHRTLSGSTIRIPLTSNSFNELLYIVGLC